MRTVRRHAARLRLLSGSEPAPAELQGPSRTASQAAGPAAANHPRRLRRRHTSMRRVASGRSLAHIWHGRRLTDLAGGSARVAGSDRPPAPGCGASRLTTRPGEPRPRRGHQHDSRDPEQPGTGKRETDPEDRLGRQQQQVQHRAGICAFATAANPKQRRPAPGRSTPGGGRPAALAALVRGNTAILVRSAAIKEVAESAAHEPEATAVVEHGELCAATAWPGEVGRRFRPWS